MTHTPAIPADINDLQSMPGGGAMTFRSRDLIAASPEYARAHTRCNYGATAEQRHLEAAQLLLPMIVSEPERVRLVAGAWARGYIFIPELKDDSTGRFFDAAALCFHGNEITCDMVSPDHADAMGYIYGESAITEPR